MTPERIERSDDERLYQPRIHSRHIRALHRICEEIREPMTVLVDRALGEFVYRQELKGTNSTAETISSDNTTRYVSPRRGERPDGPDRAVSIM